MRKKILLIAVLTLVEASLVMASHGGPRSQSIAPRTLTIILIGILIGTALLIWFLRKLSMSMEKKK